jgi:hypothetical protein
LARASFEGGLKEGVTGNLTFQTFNPGELAKKVLLGGGVTAGAMATYELFEIAKRDPKILESVVGWGPLFIIAVVVIVVVDRNFGQMIALGRDNVQAQQRMSDAMEKIAEKDDRQAEELRRLTSYNGLQTEKIMKRLDRQDYWLVQIAEVTKIRLRVEVEPGDEAKAKGASA